MTTCVHAEGSVFGFAGLQDKIQGFTWKYFECTFFVMLVSYRKIQSLDESCYQQLYLEVAF